MIPPPITPLSPVHAKTLLCRSGPAAWVTVIVKATFQLVHGQSAQQITPEKLVTEDKLGPRGSLERAWETVPYLPNAGVILGGHACAPEGTVVPTMAVRLGISRDRPVLDKTIHVFGSRTVSALSSITPFQKMPLVYERAFGGPGVAANPAGTGGPKSSVLPNLLDPRDPGIPAGFGPIAPGWAPRRGLLRGLDTALLSKSVMELPQGFDFRGLHPAPLDQQIESLRGDEWIVLDGMSPLSPRIESRLPQVMAVARHRGISGGTTREQPIDLRADLLVIDADRLRASLIWRGRFSLVSEASLEGARIVVGLEISNAPVHWLSPDEARSPGLPAEKGGNMSTETTEVDAASILAAATMPFVPGDGSSSLSAAQAAPKEPSVSGSMSTGTGAVDVHSLFRTVVPFEKTKERLPTPAAQKQAPMSTGTTDVDLGEIRKGMARLQKSPDRAVGLAPPVLNRPREPSPEALVRKRVVSVLESDLPLEGEDLEGANLSGLDLSGRSLLRCNLRGATLRGTKLSGAALRGAILDEADLRGALLDEADLRGASLVRANLERARLRRCEGADANFREACLKSADLRHAHLRGASFELAILQEAQGDEADLTGARLVEADLSSASFVGARLSSAVLAFANLNQADFRRADLERANLHKASRKRLRLAGANTSCLLDEPPGDG